MTVSTGIGAGVVAEGRLLRGARGLAGHLGFWNLAGDAVAGSVDAPDGGRTVLEHLASNTGIAREGSAACGSVGLAPGYLVALRDALSRLEPEDPLAVVAAELGADAGLLGAAALLGS